MMQEIQTYNLFNSNSETDSQAELSKSEEELATSLIYNWHPKRFTKLTESLAHNFPLEPSVWDMITRYHSLHQEQMKETTTALKFALGDTDIRSRQTQITTLRSEVSRVAGELTFLTEDELLLITYRENYSGYLYLDTLTAAIPEFSRTNHAKKKTNERPTLRTVISNEELLAVKERENVLNGLLYGAINFATVRNNFQKYRHEGKTSTLPHFVV